MRHVLADGEATVTLSASGAGVVSIDALKITARRAGTAVISQGGLTCVGERDACALVRVGRA